MTDRDDRANFGRSSQQFNALTLDLPVATAAATPDAQRVAQVVAAVPPATVTIALEDGVIARLPADADLSVPRANGADLEFVQPDGTVIVITGGAISGLVLFVGDVEIPADAVATIFASNGIVPAAGPETSGDTSGSGSFVDLSQQSVGDGLQGGGLLDNTDGPNAAVIGGDIGGDANVAPVILAHDGGRLSEEGLAEGVADAGGNTDTTDDATLSGRIVVSDVGPLTFTFLQPTGLYTSGGTPITWVAAGGTLVGSAGTETVFEAVIDATGTWTVTLKGPFDHPLGLGENELPVQLNILVSDTGGLSTPTTLTIILEDDMPALEGKIEEVVIDEADLLNGESAPRLTGALPIALGSDGGTIRLSAVGATWSEARQELQSDDGLWRIDLNDDGTYTFLLFQNSTAHSGETPNDVLDIRVTYTATDADGDVLTGDFTLGVRDDAPSFGEGMTRGRVDEDRINKNGNVASEHMGGNYDGDAVGEDEEGSEDDSLPSASFTGDLAIRWGADNENSNVAGTPDRDVTFIGVTNGQVATYDVDGVPAQLTSNGQLVHLWVSADGHTLVGYTGSDCSIGSKQVFTVTLSDVGTGSYTFTLLQNLDHPIANTEDDISLGLKVRATDSDADHTDGTIWVRVNDDAPTFSAAPQSGQIDEEWISLSGNTQYEHTYPGDGSGLGVAAGSLNISWGMDRRDGFGEIDRSVSFTGTINRENYEQHDTFRVFATNSERWVEVTHDGEPVRLWFSPDGSVLLGYVGETVGVPSLSQQVFVVALSDEGSGGYVFTLLKSLDHPGRNFEDNLRFDFEVQATDADGDSAVSTISITVNDDAPRISSPQTVTVDEDGLAGGNTLPAGTNGDVPGAATSATGSLSIAWGVDDANSGAANRSVAFSGIVNGASAQSTDGALTSGGVQVKLWAVGNTVYGYTGSDPADTSTAPAANDRVFTVTLSDTGAGSYTFTLLKPLDHASGTGENDIQLRFKYVATDGDGDTTASSFLVTIDDDAPTAVKDDAVSFNEDSGLHSGNVMTNDLQGADGATLTKVTFDGGQNWKVIADGVSDGNGAYSFTLTGVGTYTFAASGAWTFMAAPNFSGQTSFAYIITDADGDESDPEVIIENPQTITVNPVNDAPVIAGVNNATIAENSAGVLIDSFTVSDIDTATGLTFRVLRSGNVDSRFEIVAADGTTQGTPGTYELRLKAGESFDYEAEAADSDPSINLTIEVNDNSGANTLATRPIRILVTDVFENVAPVIGASTTLKTVTEDFSSTVPQGERVTNGSFEGPTSAARLSGWTVNNLLQLGEPHSGSNALSPYMGTGSLSQTISTVPGATYRIQFWASNPFDTFGEVESLTVNWGGQSVLALGNVPGSGAYRNYTLYSIDVTAQSYQTVLSIALQDTKGYWLIDDVSVATLVVPGVETVSGTIAFTDGNVTDSHVVSFTPAASGYLGTFTPVITNAATGDGAGVVTWTYSVNDADIQHLALGQTVTQSYTVYIQDSNGAVSSQQVSVQLGGTNDLPVARLDDGGSNAAFQMTEDTASKTFNVLANDTLDVDTGSPNSVTLGTITVPTNSYGIDASDLSVSVTADNQIKVDLVGSDWNKLSAGAFMTLGISYTLHGDQSGDASAAMLQVKITGANDAPVLDATLTPTFAGQQNSGAPVAGVTTGTLVSTLANLTGGGGLDNVSDVDGYIAGMAITGVNSGQGTWYWSPNGGASWTAVGAVSSTNALLLRPEYLLYFAPSANFAGTILNGLTFQAWDLSSGTPGTTVNATVNGGATALSSTSDTVAVVISDTTPPTMTSITMSDTALKIGETATVTITFSEAVSNFDNSDVTVQNGVLSPLTTADGGRTWTGTFTPSSNISDTSNVISVASSYTDTAGNTGAAGSSGNYSIDTAPPTVTVAMSDTALTAGETATVTITFSEAVTSFDATDVTVQNGVLGPLTTANGGITWTGTFTPTANITDTTNVITVATTYTDTAGNAGTAGSSANYTVITTPANDAPEFGSGDVAGSVTEPDVTLPQSILVNGSFETGSTGWTAISSAGSNTFTTSFPGHGTQNFAAHSFGPSSGVQANLAQTVSTIPGVQYTLRFSVATSSDAANGHLYVNWNGVRILAVASGEAYGYYRTFTATVVGTGSDAVGFAFDDPDLPASFKGWYLDTVSLTPAENYQSARGTLSFTDDDVVDVHSVTVSTPEGSAYVGTFLPIVDQAGNTISWTFYASDDQLQSLPAGSVNQVYTLTLADGHGGTDTQTVTITLNGVNDIASISGTSSGAVQEDGAVSTGGTLTVTDIDSGQIGFQTPASLVGTYGTFTFNAMTGVWGYTLNNAASNVQSLNASDVVHDKLTVTSMDGSASTVIDVTIQGANEVVASPLTVNDTTSAAGRYALAYDGGEPNSINLDARSLFGGGTGPVTYSYALLYSSTGDASWLQRIGTLFTGNPSSNDAGLYVYKVTATDTVSSVSTYVGLEVLPDGAFNLTINSTSNSASVVGSAPWLFTYSDGYGDAITATVNNSREANAGSGYDILIGSGGSNNFNGGADDDALYGLGGSDTLLGGANTDYINGGAGNDIIEGGGNNDFLVGGSGDDTFVWNVNDGVDVVDGGVGTDKFVITGNDSQDLIYVTLTSGVITDVNGVNLASVEQVSADLGSASNDTLTYLTSGAVTVNLATGNATGFTSVTSIERVVGGNGNDTLIGSSAANRLTGGAGDDTLYGGVGNDTLVGGTGADRFRFAESGAANKDTISDFVLGDGDSVDLSSLLDAAYSAGNTVSDFVRVTGNGTTLTVQVDTNGAVGGQNWTDVVDLSNLNTSGQDSVRVFFEGVDVIISD